MTRTLKKVICYDQVLDKLRILFTGYSNIPPTAFVLIGNFLSAPYGYKESKIMKGNLISD